MEIERLLAFISQENQRLHEYHLTLEEENSPIVQTVKLNEEMGELCDAVLGYYCLQRTKKLNGVETRDIESEFADVVIKGGAGAIPRRLRRGYAPSLWETAYRPNTMAEFPTLTFK